MSQFRGKYYRELSSTKLQKVFINIMTIIIMVILAFSIVSLCLDETWPKIIVTIFAAISFLLGIFASFVAKRIEIWR